MAESSSAERLFPDDASLDDALIVAATEMNTDDEMDALAEALTAALAS